MALKNLEIWHGTWRIETQHYRGKLIIGDKFDPAEDDSVNGNLVLHKEHHEKPEYTFRLTIPLQTVETDTIVFSGRDQRDGDEKSYPIEDLLVRYSHPAGAGNRAIGYFHWQPSQNGPKDTSSVLKRQKNSGRCFLGIPMSTRLWHLTEVFWQEGHPFEVMRPEYQ